MTDMCRIRHRHIYNYTKLYDFFFKLLMVSAYKYMCQIRYPYPYFIVTNTLMLFDPISNNNNNRCTKKIIIIGVWVKKFKTSINKVIRIRIKLLVEK